MSRHFRNQLSSARARRLARRAGTALLALLCPAIGLMASIAPAHAAPDPYLCGYGNYTELDHADLDANSIYPGDEWIWRNDFGGALWGEVVVQSEANPFYCQRYSTLSATYKIAVIADFDGVGGAEVVIDNYTLTGWGHLDIIRHRSLTSQIVDMTGGAVLGDYDTDGVPGREIIGVYLPPSSGFVRIHHVSTNTTATYITPQRTGGELGRADVLPLDSEAGDEVRVVYNSGSTAQYGYIVCDRTSLVKEFTGPVPAGGCGSTTTEPTEPTTPTTSPPKTPNLCSGSGYVAAFQANTGSLWNVGKYKNSERAGMMAGTSPSIACLPDGGYVIAFQANTGELWTMGSRGTKNWGLGMMRGTSPSVSRLHTSGFQVAFQANTGELWLAGTDGIVNTRMGMKAGTSPSATRLQGGGYVVAFQANTGNLHTTGTPGTKDWGFGMMNGTSPSITGLVGGGFAVAFQANTGFLYTTGSPGTKNWGFGMMAGTSPGITAIPNGGYRIAFQANTGVLYTSGTPGTKNWNMGMKSGTSPSITALSTGGYEVAFQANTGNLWTVGTDNYGDRGLGMMSGTSPSITGF